MTRTTVTSICSEAVSVLVLTKHYSGDAPATHSGYEPARSGFLCCQLNALSPLSGCTATQTLLSLRSPATARTFAQQQERVGGG